MFRSKKCWKELTCFFQQHKLIVSICVISALLIAKASTLPVWGGLPHNIQQYLLAPKGGSDEWEIYSILSNLSFAYISSIITYILIQYIPERRKAIKAFVTLRSDLEQIYSSMSRLISMFLFDMQIDKSESQIILSDVAEMKHMYITNECKMCEIHPYRNGVDQRTVSEDYNLHKDSHIFSEGILKRIEKIERTPCYVQLDNRIVDLLDEIKHNGFCGKLSCEHTLIEPIPSVKPVIINFDTDFVQLIHLHKCLAQYNIDLTTYEFVRITMEEREKRTRWKLFHFDRSLFHIMPEKAEYVVSGIMNIPLDDEVLEKSVAVILEMLVCHDAYPDKCKTLLQPAQKLGEYLLLSETNPLQKPLHLLNYFQVIKRDRPLCAKEKKRLQFLLKNPKNHPQILLGAAILIERFDIAKRMYDRLSDEERHIFIQFPIYHLWPDPPVPANSEPMIFTLQSKE